MAGETGGFTKGESFAADGVNLLLSFSVEWSAPLTDDDDDGLTFNLCDSQYFLILVLFDDVLRLVNRSSIISLIRSFVMAGSLRSNS